MKITSPVVLSLLDHIEHTKGVQVAEALEATISEYKTGDKVPNSLARFLIEIQESADASSHRPSGVIRCRRKYPKDSIVVQMAPGHWTVVTPMEDPFGTAEKEFGLFAKDSNGNIYQIIE